MVSQEQKSKLIIEGDDRTKAAFDSCIASLNRLASTTKAKMAIIATGFNQMAGVINELKNLFSALISPIMETARAGDEFGKLSQQIGVTVENLSALKYAAELSESNIETLGQGMGFFNKALSGSNEEGKNTTQILKALGVTARDPFEAMMQVADAFAETEDNATKTAYAMALFGKGGKEMIPLLNAGSAGIREMMDEAKRLGITFTTEGAQAADQFNDNITRMKKNLEGLAHTISGPVIEAVNNLFAAFGKSDRMSNLYSQIARIDDEIALLEKGFFGIGKPRSSKELEGIPYKQWTITERQLKMLRLQLMTFANELQTLQNQNAPAGKKGSLPGLPNDSKEKKYNEDEDPHIIALRAKWRGIGQITEEGLKKEKELRKKQEQEDADFLRKRKELLLGPLGIVAAFFREDADFLRKRKELQAQREAAIQLQLSELDRKEQTFEITKPEAVRERIRLNEELLRIQQEYQAELDKVGDTSGWYDQAKAIEETRKRLLELNLAIKEQTGTMAEGVKYGLDEYLYRLETVFQQGTQLAQSTAQGMQQAFSDFFFDAMQGKLKSLGDYVRSFLADVQRAIARVLAQQATDSIIGGIRSLLTMGTSAGSAPVDAPTTSTINVGNIAHSGGLIMHTGGYIPRFHAGGLAHDEVPAILQRGEYVVSRRGVAALDAINEGRITVRGVAALDAINEGRITVNVKIENQTGVPVQAQTKGFNTRFDAKGMIKEIILELKRTDPMFNTEMARGY